MPFGTYDELIESIENWLNREDFKAECADFVYLAEKEMATLAKLRLVDKVITGTLVDGQEWVEAPSDMVEPRFFRTDSPNVRSIEIVSIWKWQDTVEHASTVEPNAAHHHGNRIYLGPVAGTNTTYTLFYRGGFPRLSSENQTNFILEEFPMCYLYGALANAAPFIGNDERAPQWIEQAQHWIRQLRKSEARARTGGGKLRVRPDRVDGGSIASGVRR